MEYKDYYSVLGVDKKASAEDIKHAYRRLARKYHPDVSKEKNAEEQFKNVQEAYEVLKDPEKRTAYDELGSQWKSGQDFRRPPNWEERPFHQQAQGQQFTREDFSDFFSSLFGQRRPGFEDNGFEGFNQRGTDQHAKISITLEEAFKGSTKTFQLHMPERNARGQIENKVRSLKVTIPPGSLPGQQLRLVKQGSPGIGSAQPGDLYLEIEILPHPLFSLEQQDIFLKLPLTPWEAALGAEIKVPTLSGPVGLKIRPNSQTGLKMRLKGRGMPGKHKTGDQYVIVQILTPSANNDEQKKLYESMAKIMPFDPRKDWRI